LTYATSVAGVSWRRSGCRERRRAGRQVIFGVTVVRHNDVGVWSGPSSRPAWHRWPVL